MKPFAKTLLLIALFITPLGGYFSYKTGEESWAEVIASGGPISDYNPTPEERQIAGIKAQIELGIAETRRSLGVALLGTASICMAIAAVTTFSPILQRWINALSYHVNRVDLK